MSLCSKGKTSFFSQPLHFIQLCLFGSLYPSLSFYCLWLSSSPPSVQTTGKVRHQSCAVTECVRLWPSWSGAGKGLANIELVHAACTATTHTHTHSPESSKLILNCHCLTVAYIANKTNIERAHAGHYAKRAHTPSISNL